jgi:hypothetical protein
VSESAALLVWGIMAHCVADWFLQNDWMARNKARLLDHPAGLVHGAIYALCMVVVFGPVTAWTLAMLHAWIDTRAPLAWWRRVFRQTTEGPAVIHMAFWQDQAAHVLLIAGAAVVTQLVGRI